MRLHAKLEATLDAETPDPLVAKRLYTREVRIVVHVQHALAFSDLGTERVFPVWLDAIVHMVREANLVEVPLPGISTHLLGRVPGVIRKHAVHVVVSKHGRPFRETGNRQFSSSII